MFIVVSVRQIYPHATFTLGVNNLALDAVLGFTSVLQV